MQITTFQSLAAIAVAVTVLVGVGWKVWRTSYRSQRRYDAMADTILGAKDEITGDITPGIGARLDTAVTALTASLGEIAKSVATALDHSKGVEHRLTLHEVQCAADLAALRRDVAVAEALARSVHPSAGRPVVHVETTNTSQGE